MKLSCKKCNKLLTEDLYLVNPKYNKGVTTNNKMFDKGKHVEVVYLSEVGQWKEVTGDSSGVEVSGERETYFERGRFKKGIFSIFRASKKNWNFEKSGIKGYQMTIKKVKRIAVSDRSILDGIIPAFKEGCGCCNWAMGRELFCPDCGELIGKMYLDCYEDGCVDFIDSKVVRVYS